MESFQETFTKVKDHQSTKRIQATEFQANINHPNNVQAYQCELPNETVGALWTQRSVIIFLCVVYHNSDTKIFISGTDYKGKDTFSAGLFAETLIYNYILPDDKAEEETIWSDGPASKFKNQFVHC